MARVFITGSSDGLGLPSALIRTHPPVGSVALKNQNNLVGGVPIKRLSAVFGNRTN
jgi:hypothetical protein